MEHLHADTIDDIVASTLDEVDRNIGEPSPVEHPSGILNCCRGTIDLHARNNPMMVCTHCKQIIKCFEDDPAYNNYVRFCLSRHRKIVSDVYNGWKVVVFKSYETFSS